MAVLSSKQHLRSIQLQGTEQTRDIHRPCTGQLMGNAYQQLRQDRQQATACCRRYDKLVKSEWYCKQQVYYGKQGLLQCQRPTA